MPHPWLRSALVAVPVAVLPVLEARAESAPAPPVPPVVAACAAAPALRAPDPFSIELVPTAQANGARGGVRLRFAASPFGLAVAPDGRHVYDLELTVQGLGPEPGTVHIAWATTPELDQVAKLGTLTPGEALASRVQFNKFLVFVTAEPSADVERWSGPILLRGISRSGRLHTMAGHGPFEGEPC